MTKKRNLNPHLASPFNAWMTHHQQCFEETSLVLLHKKLSSFLTIGVIAIALALPTIFLSLANQMTSLSHIFNATPKINLYLKPDIGDEAIQGVSERLIANPNVKTTNIISPDNALEELQDSLSLGGAEAFFETNPLPTTIVITPMDDVAVDTLTDLESAFAGYGEVESVQVDTEWVRRWKSLVIISEKISHFITLSLLIAVLFIIGNTIRLEVRQQEEHIRISKLMGATNTFIRRPFIYTGFFYGISGGVLALLLVLFFYQFLRGNLTDFLSTFSPAFTDAFSTSVSHLHYYLPLAGIFIGIMGAWVSVQYHIKNISVD